MSEERQSGTWGRAASLEWSNPEHGRQALAAALPPLIFGLAIVAMFLIIVPLDRVVIGGPSRVAGLYAPSLRLTVGLGVGLAMGGVLIVGGLVAAVRRLPAWGYTWVGGGLMGLFLLLVLLDVGLVNGGLAWMAARAWQPWYDARGGLSAASSH